VLAAWLADELHAHGQPPAVTCTGRLIAGGPLTFAIEVKGVYRTCCAKVRSASTASYLPIGREVIPQIRQCSALTFATAPD